MGDGDHLLGLLDLVGEGLCDRFGAHVAAGDGPLVVLFGEDGSDEADDRGAVGEDEPSRV